IVFDTLKAGLGDFRFKTSAGNVSFDRQVDISGTAFMSPEVVRIGELRGPSGKIEIPLRIKGEISNPQPDIEYSLKIMGPRIAKGALKSKVSTEAKKKVESQIK